LFVVIAMYTTGCSSLSTMQTARVVDKDDILTTIGFSSVKTEYPIGTIDTIKLNTPFAEISGRYGLGNNFDIGAKLTIIGTATIDGKYQFLGDNISKVAGSCGLGFSYFSFESGNNKSRITDIMIPTYFSYHPAKWFSIYSSPKYILKINSYTSDKTNGCSISHWYGGTVGIKLGNRTGFLIEYSFFGQSNYKRPVTQLTAGFCFVRN